MAILNYALSSGNNANLATVQADGTDILFQIYYTGIVAANVSVESWISTRESGPFAKLSGSEKTLVGSDGTAYISLQGLNFGFIRFKLVVPTASTAGTITEIDVLK